jgi:hypothetical protein
MEPQDSVAPLAGTADWTKLSGALEKLPACLADLRRPLRQRFLALDSVLADCDESARALIDLLVAHRDLRFADPRSWESVGARYPQPEPTLTLALREWILALGAEPAVPLNHQKRLASALTEILVARAAILTYSERLHEPTAGPLVRMLGALWVLVAASWKTRPLLGTTDREDDE